MTAEAPGQKNCPACGEQKSSVLFQEGKDYFVAVGNSPDFAVRLCARCGTGFSMPPMTAAQLAGYYPDDYEAYLPKKSLAGFLQKMKYRSDLAMLRNSLKKTGGSIFEIGAGRGEFLHEAKKGGFEAYGLEPSEAGVRFAAQNYHLGLIRGHAEDFMFPGVHDAVIARHVIEHLEEPAFCAVKIFDQGLKDGGVLMLKLPRLDSWEARRFGKFWHGFDLPRHRTHFTRAGVRLLLEKAGFSEIHIFSEAVPTDLMRSLRYFAAYGPKGLPRTLAAVWTVLPWVLQMGLAECLTVILSPWGTGRMIVIAKKGKKFE